MSMRTQRQQIEDVVQELLDENGISSPPVPVERLARTRGLQIVEQGMDSDISGALINLGDQTHGIAVNATQAPVRKRFTVAHELGHFLLQHVPEEDHLDWGFTVIRRDGRSSEANDLQEMEANFFAASLLMPKRMLRADVEAKRGFYGEVTIDDAEIQKLAKRYGVSRVAMQYRLMNVGLLSFVEGQD